MRRVCIDGHTPRAPRGPRAIEAADTLFELDDEQSIWLYASRIPIRPAERCSQRHTGFSRSVVLATVVRRPTASRVRVVGRPSSSERTRRSVRRGDRSFARRNSFANRLHGVAPSIGRYYTNSCRCRLRYCHNLRLRRRQCNQSPHSRDVSARFWFLTRVSNELPLEKKYVMFKCTSRANRFT